MTEQEKERLLAYLLNKTIRLDNDVIDRRNAMYRHENYVTYYFELAEALIRQRAFREFSEDVLKILHLHFGDSDTDRRDDDQTGIYCAD